MVQAYCQGVNHYFAKRRVPWELRWLGYRFEPWTTADVFLVAKLAGLIGLSHTQAVLERFIVECVQNGISRDRLEALFPGQLGGLNEELIRHVRLQEPLIPSSLKWASALPTMFASNNWVLSGKKTASGKPYLCNDPHLEVSRLPAVWYEAVLRWRTGGVARYAMGASLPGVPGLVLGRTDNLAWGVTYAFMDTIDSWIEECRDGNHRRGTECRPFAVRKEIVRRKKGPAEEIRFYDNDHGVLEGDPTIAGFYLATRWSCGEGTSAAVLEAGNGILTARTVEEGRQLLGRISNASWNWVLADRGGNIGYQMSGRMPRRRPSISGLVPLPGWDTANDWQGFEPPEKLPRLMNPVDGFIATANEDRNHLGQVQPINVAMAAYRVERIRDMLRSAQKLTIEDMKRLQLDLHSTQAEQFMTIMRPLLAGLDPGAPESGRDAALRRPMDAPANTADVVMEPDLGLGPQARDQVRVSQRETRVAASNALAEWDLRYTSDSKGAFVFEQVYRALFSEVFGRGHGGLGPAVLDWLWNETFLLTMFHGSFDRVLLSAHSPWFGGRPRRDIYRAALDRALGVPPEPYGLRRQVQMRHLLMGGKLPRFLGFDRLIELRGGRATIPQIQICRNHGRTSGIGASLRLVTDLATDEMHTALPGGPSDRRFSRWYTSDLASWLAGRLKIVSGLAPASTKGPRS
jgi:penicillin amidase